MRSALFLFATLFALAGFAVDEPKPAVAKKAPNSGKSANVLPDSVEGVPAEEYAKIRRALMLSYGNEAISAARLRLNELKERTRFTKGRNEAEDLRLDFEKARDAMVKATMDSVLKIDASINKDSLVFTLNAIEEATKKRGQEAMQRAREKEAAEAKLAKKDAPEAKPETTEAKVEEKPMTPAQLLADVEGVSAEDMTKFRIAAFVAQKDPTVKELKAKQNEMRKEAEFASPDEKKNMRNDFEVLIADLRKAHLAAVSKADPSLSKETLEKIMEAVEGRAKAAAKKGSQATKTPLKPFPFGEKK
ncbi:MAG: hypothetical protein CAK86_06005 [Opitutia bacterium AMD-G1]|nr:MAG: hypothetical protein CAK86_06005 [Opitutae bacterium AMD-G1]